PLDHPPRRVADPRVQAEVERQLMRRLVDDRLLQTAGNAGIDRAPATGRGRLRQGEPTGSVRSQGGGERRLPGPGVDANELPVRLEQADAIRGTAVVAEQARDPLDLVLAALRHELALAREDDGDQRELRCGKFETALREVLPEGAVDVLEVLRIFLAVFGRGADQ